MNIDAKIESLENELSVLKQRKKELDRVFCPLCESEMNYTKGSYDYSGNFGPGDQYPTVVCTCGFSFSGKNVEDNILPKFRR